MWTTNHLWDSTISSPGFESSDFVRCRLPLWHSAAAHLPVVLRLLCAGVRQRFTNLPYDDGRMCVMQVWSMPVKKKGKSTCVGWTFYRIFNAGSLHVNQGSVCLPLFEGSPSHVRLLLARTLSSVLVVADRAHCRRCSNCWTRWSNARRSPTWTWWQTCFARSL
jgi:hypothetical protein